MSTTQQEKRTHRRRRKLLKLLLRQKPQQSAARGDSVQKGTVEVKSELQYNRVDQLWDDAAYNPEEAGRYLFTVRRTFDCEGKYQMTRVDIKSKLLKETLADVIDGIKDVGLSEDSPEIDPKILFLYLEDLREVADTLKSTTDSTNDDKIEHIQILLGYLDTEFAQTKKTLSSMRASSTITFDLLWTLYKPNTIAYTTTYGTPSEARAFQVKYAEKEFTLLKGEWYKVEGEYLECDGKTWGRGTIVCDVASFKGTRKITSLKCYPMSYVTEEQNVRKALIDRGKKFVSLQGAFYKYYDGTAYYKKGEGLVKVHVKGRVMIDPVTHRRINSNYPLSALRDRRAVEHIETNGNTKAPVFTDDEYLIATSVVLGFAFSEKLWLELAVSRVADITWNDNAYESLVLEDGRKDIITSLVKSHNRRPAERMDDIIRGKGNGLAVLLHGLPGTGKTLTVESVAELLKCPLYTISAGELGTNARVLESELRKILDISMTWGCMILLDEADVFLEQRTVHDIHRNALVSVFLQLLEYFQGILFLTTNRVETFDGAFHSRIHIALQYKKLSTEAKKNIFKMFISRVSLSEGGSDLSFRDEDFSDLAKHNLNGRQIKNTVSTAQALALECGEVLGMKHVCRVLDVTLEFEKDLKGGTGYEDAMRNYC